MRPPNQPLRLLPGFAGLLAALVVAASCTAGATPGASEIGQGVATTTALPSADGPIPAIGGEPIPVLGTENFYADLLAEIGGARVRASSLLNNPNTDPHAYEASPQAALAVADARVVIVNGLGYDDFMAHLLAASPDASRVVLIVQQLLGLPDTANAHVWYDPTTMPIVARAAEAALARIEPGNAAYFEARLATYLASLETLTARVAQLRAAHAGTPVAFTEPVAGYLAQAIGLRVLTPEGFQRAVENGTDPAPADVAAEQDLLTGRKVRVLLYNSQAVSPLTTRLEQLATANGIPVVGVTETMPPAYRTYVAWQLAQLDELERALSEGA